MIAIEKHTECKINTPQIRNVFTNVFLLDLAKNPYTDNC